MTILIANAAPHRGASSEALAGLRAALKGWLLVVGLWVGGGGVNEGVEDEDEHEYEHEYE